MIVDRYRAMGEGVKWEMMPAVRWASAVSMALICARIGTREHGGRWRSSACMAKIPLTTMNSARIEACAARVRGQVPVPIPAPQCAKSESACASCRHRSIER